MPRRRRWAAGRAAPLQQLADGYMHIANMGFQGADATNILQAAMESAVSTGGNTADVANVLANVMHEFALKGNQAAQTMDILHTAAAQGNMTLEQMTLSFGPVAAIASTIGVPLDQAAAAMAAITRHGFDAAEAGTQLKNFMEKLAAPTAGATAEIKKLATTTGVDLTSDFSQAGLASKGLTGVLDDIARATGGNVQAFNQLMGGAQLTTDQMNAMAEASHGNLQALQKLDPNIRGLYAEFILTGRGAGDYLDILHKIDTSTQGAGITAESYARTQDTLAFAMGTIKNGLEAAAIAVGTKFLPQLTALAEMINTKVVPMLAVWASGMVDRLMPTLQRLPEIVQTQVVPFIQRMANTVQTQVLPALGAFADYLGGTLIPGIQAFAGFAQSMLIPAIQQLAGYVQDQLAPAIQQFAAYLQANVIPMVQEAATTIQTQIVPAVEQLAGYLQTDLAAAVGVVQQNLADFGAMVQAVSGYIRDHTAEMSVLLGVLAAVATAVGLLTAGMIAQGIADLALRGYLMVTQVATEAYAAAQWLLNAALTANPIGIVIVLLAGLVAGLVYAYKNSETFRDIVDGAMRAVGAAFSVLGTTAQTVTTAIGGFFSALGATISGIIDGINSKIQAAMAAIDGLRAAASNIANIVGGAASAVGSVAHNAAGAVPHFAGGTNYAPGGLAVVGENGPELVNLPRGSEVFPNGQAPTSPLRPASGGGSGNIYITVTGNTILNDQDASRLATVIGRHLVQQTGAAYSLAGLGGR
jgi:hypothetical protein